MYTGIFFCGLDGVGGELHSAYQCVVSHYVQLHVLGCTQGIPFNLTGKTKGRWEHGYAISLIGLLDYIIHCTTPYYTRPDYSIL